MPLLILRLCVVGPDHAWLVVDLDVILTLSNNQGLFYHLQRRRTSQEYAVLQAENMHT